jgi:hypothetical protein
MRSAIYLPRRSGVAPPELVELLEGPAFQALIGLALDLGRTPEPEMLRKQRGEALGQFTDREIADALKIVSSPTDGDDSPSEEGDDGETTFRRAEFAALREGRREEQLVTMPQQRRAYASEIAEHFQTVTLVPKLRETRALVGFSRVLPENDQSLEGQKSLLWRNPPMPNGGWLPACVVYGEGLYFEVDEGRLRAWETRPEVVARVAGLARRYQRVQQERRLRERQITPRFVLLHTLGHILMNQLTFDCGYGTASLRERLYASANASGSMSGVLVYTAAGDAEGTMGGLVRMGKPGYLEPAVRRGLRNAQWCSSDPVCMELGASGGQGPDSCNLAACHNCALVPETSCEEFNRFLDRGLVIGTLDVPSLGFFSSMS